jgi:hypothetical protein
MAGGLPGIGKSVQDATIDPSKAGNATDKLMSPNAQEDPETVTGDNPQQAWKPGGKKPSGPFGPQGRNF